MGRPRSTAGGRPVPLTVRLSEAEARDMDARKGSLSRSDWIRYLMTDARKRDVRLGATPRIIR